MHRTNKHRLRHLVSAIALIMMSAFTFLVGGVSHSSAFGGCHYSADSTGRRTISYCYSGSGVQYSMQHCVSSWGYGYWQYGQATYNQFWVSTTPACPLPMRIDYRSMANSG